MRYPHVAIEADHAENFHWLVFGDNSHLGPWADAPAPNGGSSVEARGGQFHGDGAC